MSASKPDEPPRIALVTGASRGIGRAAALALAKSGAHVVALARTQGGLEELDDEIRALRPDELEATTLVPMDLRDFVAIDRLGGALHRRWGRLDVLVGNAGVLGLLTPLHQLDPKAWDEVMAVNVTGVFLCARIVARQMIRQGGGAIVNMASIMGLSGGGLYPNISYQTSKGAVVNLTRALAIEWASSGIRVNAVPPTWVRTDFIRPLLGNPELVRRIEQLTPLGRLADPEDIVGAVAFLCGPGATFITGQTMVIDGGQYFH